MLLLALIALGVPLALSFRDRVDTEVRSQAESQAALVATSASEVIAPPRPGVLERLARVSAETVRGRVIVVDSRGRLLADSAGVPLGESYADRPEIAGALDGHDEQISRESATLDEEILATAVPVVQRGQTAGAVRITQSVEAVDGAVRNSILNVLGLGAVVLALALIAGALIAQQIARPIRRLDRTAQQVAAGDLDASAPVEGSKEQRSLARSFNEMTQRLKRLLSVQQDFVADASHQLRTPLTGLRLRIENLGASHEGDIALEGEVDASLREVDRLSLIVEELLILSRAGESELPGEQLDLADAVRRAGSRWEAAARERRIALAVETSEPAPGWCAGPDLDRTIDVLIENALLYSPPSSTVTITGAPGRVAILDEGPGLAEGEEEAVFERFARGTAGRRVPSGTGLGLPIARELARSWGGDVNLSNRAQGGLCAVIELEDK